MEIKNQEACLCGRVVFDSFEINLEDSYMKQQLTTMEIRKTVSHREGADLGETIGVDVLFFAKE